METKLRAAQLKHYYAQQRKLRKLSKHDREVYLAVQDPKNEVMQQLKYSENIDTLLAQELQQRIIQKQKASAESEDPENTFLNSLTQQEYVYFVETRKSDKWDASGVKTEFVSEKMDEQVQDFDVPETEEIANDLSAEELREQFKVFRDPNFQEFLQITGTKHNPDLPLFAQLFVLREARAFKAFVQEHLWMSYLGSNIAIQLCYFLFQRKYMFCRQTQLISVWRIFAIWFLQSEMTTHLGRALYADKYHVDLNSLLDLDDDFLQHNEEYRRLVKTVVTQHSHLVNQNFDVKVQCRSAPRARDP